MEDGRRYMVYYTFEPKGDQPDESLTGQEQSESASQDKEQQNV